MTTMLTIVGVLAVCIIILLLLFACCKVAADADRAVGAGLCAPDAQKGISA